MRLLCRPWVAFGLVVVLVLLFAWLAHGVVGGRWAEWNDAVGNRVRARTNPVRTGVAVAVSSLCDGRHLALLVLAAVGLLLVRRRYLDAVGLLAVIAGVVAMENVLKPLFGIARPVLPDSPFKAEGYSFPSGHALRAVGFFGYLAAVAVAGGWRTAGRWAVAAGCVVLAVAVCWTRVYLGVHWPTDVIGGALAAAAWVTACLIARHYALTRRSAPDRVGPG
jgi:undecaprenyl-diphosphatase